MEDLRVTTDGVADVVAGDGSGGMAALADLAPDPSVASLFVTPPNGKEGTMNQVESFEEAPAASLVGSLAVFTLANVLTLLADTGQTGELQLVSEAANGKLWLAQGDLSNAQVGAAATVGQAVFELACIADGWFYFTSGLSSSNGQPAIPVAAVLSEVRPQVDEWRDLGQVVPLEATVSLSPTPPGQDVQIRSDQWRVLTTVGNGGHTVKTVIEVLGGDPVVGRRALRDLQSVGLIVLGPPSSQPPDQLAASYLMATGDSAPVTTLPAPPPPPPPPPMSVVDEPVADQPSVPSPPPPDLEPVTASGDRFGDLAAVSIMPPPIASDPWSPVVEASASSGENGVA
jgi:hypothetical protein